VTVHVGPPVSFHLLVFFFFALETMSTVSYCSSTHTTSPYVL
jgi:hypothetical protein